MKKVIYALVAVLAIVGCKQKENVVTIGVISPMTGAGAACSAYWVNGFNMAIDHLNQASDGIKYEIQFEDCQSNPAEAVNCYKRLEQRGWFQARLRVPRALRPDGEDLRRQVRRGAAQGVHQALLRRVEGGEERRADQLLAVPSVFQRRVRSGAAPRSGGLPQSPRHHGVPFASVPRDAAGRACGR